MQHFGNGESALKSSAKYLMVWFIHSANMSKVRIAQQRMLCRLLGNQCHEDTVSGLLLLLLYGGEIYSVTKLIVNKISQIPL